MTFDGILTLIGLVIAALTITPRSRLLEVKLQFGAFAWAALASTVFGVLYLQYYRFFIALGWHFSLGLKRWGLTPSNVSFLIILVFTIFLALYLHGVRLTRNRLPRFKLLQEELLCAGNINELVAIFERYFGSLMKIYNRDFRLARFHRYLFHYHPMYLDSMLADINVDLCDGTQNRRPRAKTAPRLLSALARPFRDVFPNFDASRKTALEIIQDTLLSNDVAECIVATRPYLLLCLIEHEPQFAEDIAVKYLQLMFQHSNSILYSEIAKNTNTSADSNYVIPESNRLLHYLLADARKAKNLQVWRGIGEGMLTELDRLTRTAGMDPGNLAVDKYYEEEGRWKWPLFVGLRFFDLMVRRAFHQGIEWHMWLYYMTSVTDGIVRNYKPDQDPLVDETIDLPTRYAELLWNIVRTLLAWIEGVMAVSEDRKDLLIKYDSLEYENGNIPKSAIIALGHCMSSICKAESITTATKECLVHAIFATYFRLRLQVKHDSYAKLLLESIIMGGRNIGPLYPQTLSVLQSAFRNYDTIPHQKSHVDDVKARLGM